MTEAVLPSRPLPAGSIGRHASGYWGILLLILSEAALFAYLLFSYCYFAVRAHETWPPNGLPHFRIAAPNTAILILSSICVWWGERSLRRENSKPKLLLGLAGGVTLGAVFIGLQLLEWRDAQFRLYTNTYASLFFRVTGFHMAHVVLGVLILAVLLLWSALGYFGRGRYAPVTIGSLYWHFVDAVWILVFFAFYVMPYLG